MDGAVRVVPITSGKRSMLSAAIVPQMSSTFKQMGMVKVREGMCRLKRKKRRKNRRMLFDRRKSHIERVESGNNSGNWCVVSEEHQPPGSCIGEVTCPLINGHLRVLSLFDGISTGLYVLDQLKIGVESYYSCEIDAAALDVQRCNYRDRICNLGSVTCLSAGKLHSLGRVHLLIGGSPCEDLSLVNHRRRGLYRGITQRVCRQWYKTTYLCDIGLISDPNGTGVLFFDFVRILHQLKRRSIAEQYEFYWLYENVCHMDTSTKHTMSRFLGCTPVKVQSIKFSDMSRDRYFWGNIPHMDDVNSRTVESRVTLQSILEPHRLANVSKLPTLTTNSHSQKSGHQNDLPVLEDGEAVRLLICEVERMFGFPEGYTKGHDLSKSARVRLLGKSWSVPVVKAILSGLKKYGL